MGLEHASWGIRQRGPREIPQQIQRFACERDRPWTGKTVLKRGNTATLVWGRARLSGAELKSPKINPHVYGQLIFDAEIIRHRKDFIFSKWCQDDWTSPIHPASCCTPTLTQMDETPARQSCTHNPWGNTEPWLMGRSEHRPLKAETARLHFVQLLSFKRLR